MVNMDLLTTGGFQMTRFVPGRRSDLLEIDLNADYMAMFRCRPYEEAVETHYVK